MAQTVRKVVRFPDAAAVSREATRWFCELADAAATARGAFHVALSGGTTPLHFYRTLVSADYRDRVRWGSVRVFWSDERPVPPDHTESNYGLAQRELLAHVPLLRGNIHRMEAERTNLDVAAREYEDAIRRNVPAGDDGKPHLDLIYLGLGADGHTASLFPGSKALGETERLVVATKDSHGAPRMTFTLPLLNAARHVVFLVTGAGKAGALREVVKRMLSFPASRVAPQDGALHFLVDNAAASLLTE